jgi:hypothetical protein
VSGFEGLSVGETFSKRKEKKKKEKDPKTLQGPLD